MLLRWPFISSTKFWFNMSFNCNFFRSSWRISSFSVMRWRKSFQRHTFFFKILRRWFFHDWWRGCWNFLIKVVHFITWWTSHESMWLRTFVGEIGFTSSEKLRQESDKFVGIDMDVKEILLNGYQIKAAKEFCNQGAYLKPLTRAMVTTLSHYLLRDIYIYKPKIAQRYIRIYIYTHWLYKSIINLISRLTTSPKTTFLFKLWPCWGKLKLSSCGLLGNIFQKLEKVQGALEMCQKALNDFMVSWIFNQLTS